MAGLPKAFKEIGCISKETLQIIEDLGFERATPVQEATIPLFCGNKDVAVDACTGSGKTLAFIIPVVERLRKLEEKLKHTQVGAIIVSPTRELSRQIYQVAEPFINSVPGLTSCLLVGGSDPSQDAARFKEQGGHVIIGTPGRIDDVMKRCAALDPRRLEVLVLDEADRLLDMGFKVQLDAIMARLPKQRRTGLFSATQTEAVEALARAGLRNPVRVAVAVAAAPAAAGKPGHPPHQQQGAAEGQKTPTGLQIQYALLEADQKLPHLLAFLQQHQQHKTIVYFLTCLSVDYYSLVIRRLLKDPAARLQQQQQQQEEERVFSLHGKMKQAAREQTLAAFAAAPHGVLLCTDLAARGLDIPDVHWIVQYDPPQDPSAFVHRVGRTARMGRSGAALAYLLPHESSYVDFLRLRKVPLAEAEETMQQLHMGLAAAQQQQQQGELHALCGKLRKEAEGDREVMEKAVKAFVSYVRGYKEHHCKFIFRVSDLNLGRLAMGMGLLRLPRLPDVRRPQGTELFTPSAVDPDTVRYKDKGREKQRQQLLKQRQQQQLQQQEEQQKAKKRPAAAEAGKRLTASKRRMIQAKEEYDDLQQEYSLLKKLKKGKISEHEFDVATGLSSDSEPEDAAPKAKQQRQAMSDSDGSASDSDSDVERANGKAAAGAAGRKVVGGGHSKHRKGGGTGGLLQQQEQQAQAKKMRKLKKQRRKQFQQQKQQKQQ